ncbi:Fe-S cluster assembly protein HesB [Nakamurella antarctica]|uniref:Fe-S cluster assembly protein HesB n=1 Tax=Nakamurella antarctica TaxID=1902245 RepID=A0A3G8ZT79_9ACTN|nr:HhH-GPD-type base excision DNA repair protein [Nakamurella antarctica]AZI57684.1 Fe-S cluster assembly protein HesB [Nakamurella antarctica]
MSQRQEFYLTGIPEADALLARDANALLLGMVLDQQIMMEKAFAGPAVIAERMGGTLDVAAIAGAAPDEFASLCSAKPAIHRFPGSMAGRLQALCQVLVDEYGRDASNIWATVSSGAELKNRIAALPGFGDEKASIFIAFLGKQYGVTPDGWREAAGRYGIEGTFISLADACDLESITLVRASKKAAKLAAKQVTIA